MMPEGSDDDDDCDEVRQQARFHQQRVLAMQARSGMQFAANPREFDRYSGLPTYGAELSSDDDYDDDGEMDVYDGAGGGGGGRLPPRSVGSSGLHSEFGNGPGVVERLGQGQEQGQGQGLEAPPSSATAAAVPKGILKGAGQGPGKGPGKGKGQSVIDSLRAQIRRGNTARARGDLVLNDGDDDDYVEEFDENEDEEGGCVRVMGGLAARRRAENRLPSTTFRGRVDKAAVAYDSDLDRSDDGSD